MTEASMDAGEEMEGLKVSTNAGDTGLASNDGFEGSAGPGRSAAAGAGKDGLVCRGTSGGGIETLFPAVDMTAFEPNSCSHACRPPARKYGAALSFRLVKSSS